MLARKARLRWQPTGKGALLELRGTSRACKESAKAKQQRARGCFGEELRCLMP